MPLLDGSAKSCRKHLADHLNWGFGKTCPKFSPPGGAERSTRLQNIGRIEGPSHEIHPGMPKRMVAHRQQKGWIPNPQRLQAGGCGRTMEDGIR